MTFKPRSMPSGLRNVIRPNDSASLWNCTLSPGWTRDECDVLKAALMKLGVGNWRDIVESGCLPGKSVAQLNLQTQRMLGQQSTAEFAGLHLDPTVIGRINATKQGPDVMRKNGCIVNTGGKVTKDELKRKIAENKEKYELPQEEWSRIELPKKTVQSLSRFSGKSHQEKLDLLESKRQLLLKLQQELEKVQEEMKQVRPEVVCDSVETVPEPSSQKKSLREKRRKVESDEMLARRLAAEEASAAGLDGLADYYHALAEDDVYMEEDDDFVKPTRRKVKKVPSNRMKS